MSSSCYFFILSFSLQCLACLSTTSVYRLRVSSAHINIVWLTSFFPALIYVLGIGDSGKVYSFEALLSSCWLDHISSKVSKTCKFPMGLFNFCVNSFLISCSFPIISTFFSSFPENSILKRGVLLYFFWWTCHFYFLSYDELPVPTIISNFTALWYPRNFWISLYFKMVNIINWKTCKENFHETFFYPS